MSSRQRTLGTLAASEEVHAGWNSPRSRRLKRGNANVSDYRHGLPGYRWGERGLPVVYAYETSPTNGFNETASTKLPQRNGFNETTPAEPFLMVNLELGILNLIFVLGFESRGTRSISAIERQCR